MIELNVDEINALARVFLTGRGREEQLQQAQEVVEEDPQFPLELLAQMQSALDDVPPYGFTREQWKIVDQRVSALYATRVRRHFFNPIAWLLGLFKSAPKPATTAGAEAEPKRRWRGAAAPVEDVSSSTSGDGIEDMAPISAVPTQVKSAPVVTRRPIKIPWGLIKALLAVTLLVLVGWFVTPWIKAYFAKPAPQEPAPPPQPKGPPRRAAPASAPNDEPLPAEIAPQDPRSAGALTVDGQPAPTWVPTPLGRRASAPTRKP